MSDWSRRAQEVIAQVHAQLPDTATFKERKAALRAAYPFGERRYWPHKAWCRAQRAYLAKYDPKAPPPPLLRDVLRERVDAGDIIFPFKESPNGSDL